MRPHQGRNTLVLNRSVKLSSVASVKHKRGPGYYYGTFLIGRNIYLSEVVTISSMDCPCEMERKTIPCKVNTVKWPKRKWFGRLIVTI